MSAALTDNPTDAAAGPARRGRSLRASFSPRDVLFVLFRHKGKALAAFVAVLLLATLATLVLPATYVSHAELQVRLGRESVSIDPAASIGQSAMPMQNRDVEINTEVELLRSRRLAETVASRVGPDRIRQDDAKTATEQERLAEAADKLQKKFEVAQRPDSEILVLAYESDDPSLARDVVDAYVAAFPELRVATSGSDSQSVFANQRDAARAELERLDREIRELKDRTGLADLAAQRTNLLGRLDVLDRQTDATRADLAAATAAVDELKMAVAAAPEQVVTSRTTGSPLSSVESLRQQLTRLRIEERELSTRYVETSPTVVAKREEIKAAETLLSQAIESAEAQETTGVNATREALQLRLTAAQAEAASLQAKLRELEAAYKAAAAGMGDLNATQVELDELEREANIAEAKYLRYDNTFEEGRIESALEADRITNIKVVSGASTPTKPDSPNRKLLLIVGLFIATICGAGTAFAADAIDHTVKRPDDLARIAAGSESSLPADACVSIPMLRSGDALAKGPADYFDDIAHTLAVVFGTAGTRSSRLAVGTTRRTRGLFRSAGHIALGTLRGLLLVPLLVGNGVVSGLSWIGNRLTSKPHEIKRRAALATASQRNSAAADRAAVALSGLGGLSLDGDLVAEYEEIQDEDLGEVDRPEPRAAPERRFWRGIRLAAFGVRRDITAWWRREERPNLYLTSRRHRTAAASAVWRAARGLVEHLQVESGAGVMSIPKAIAVVGAKPDSGTTTVASHLAGVIAERLTDDDGDGRDRKPVLLLRVAEVAPGQAQPAVEEIDGVDRIRTATNTTIPGLSIAHVTSVQSKEVRRALQAAMSDWQHVVLDLPPVFGDLAAQGRAIGVREEAGPRLAAIADAAVLVVESGRLRREAASRALERLDRSGAEVHVAVLNKRDYPVPQWLYERA